MKTPMLAPEVVALTKDLPPMSDALLQLPPLEAARLLRGNRPLPPPGQHDGVLVEEAHTGAVPVRLYRPMTQGPHPVLLHFHGGGFVVGDRAADERRMLAVARGADCLVVSIGYRLAPEHPFPAALEDGERVVQWLRDSARTLNAGATRLAVSGSSAGAALAAGLALKLHEMQSGQIRLQWLVNPGLDCRLQTQSYAQFADGPLLTKNLMGWFWKQYRAPSDPKLLRYFSPTLAPDPALFPPTLIQVAECDVLRDDGLNFGAQLEAAGVPTTVETVQGAAHGFMQWGFDLAVTQAALGNAITHLQRAFA